jgi:hypothetical protein
VKKVAKGVVNVAEEVFEEVVEKPGKKVIKAAEEVFEEVVEKPVKKIGTEVTDTILGIDKEDRRPPPPLEPEITPEVTPEVVPDDTVLARGRRGKTRTKRPGVAGTLLEGGGVLYD